MGRPLASVVRKLVTEEEETLRRVVDEQAVMGDGPFVVIQVMRSCVGRVSAVGVLRLVEAGVQRKGALVIDLEISRRIMPVVIKILAPDSQMCHDDIGTQIATGWCIQPAGSGDHHARRI